MNNHIYIHSLFPATYRSVGYLPAAAPSPCCSYYKRQELQRTQGKGSQLPRQSSSQAGAGQLLASSRQAFCQPRPIEEDAVTAQKLPNFLQLRYLRRREGEKGEGGGGGPSKEQPGRSRGGGGGRQAATSDWQLAAQKSPEKGWWVASTTLSSCLPPCLPTGCQS